MQRLTPGAALLPLRVFLGATFVYAGIQKLSDPGFLHVGAPTYIGTQLQGFANGTPGGFILRAFALPHSILAGVGVAILEILIGLLAGLGLLTRAAAAAGLGLSLLLFLTASWHTTPYFLGPDIVFTFAWLPFALTGASGQPALDHVAKRGSAALISRMRLAAPAPRPDSRWGEDPRRGEPEWDADPALTRRLLLTQVGLGALTLAGIAALAKGTFHGSTTTAASLGGSGSKGAGAGAGAQGAGASSASGTAAGGQAGAGGSAAAATPASSSLPSNAVKLGPSARLPKGQAATYSDPGDGSADILIRGSDGSLTAFSAVCTHAGCEVGYQGGEIVCPCHGAVYNAQSGQVEAGPAPTGLAPKQVVEQGGQIYAVPA